MGTITDLLNSRIMESQDKKLYLGAVIHSQNQNQVTIIPKAVLVVIDGKVAALEPLMENSQMGDIISRFEPNMITKLHDTQFIIPGFIDTHIHAPQFPNAGVGYNMPLLEWLNRYTFPLESQYHDVSRAKVVYCDVVKRTLRCGTTTAAYFGTIHADSCIMLAEAARLSGQRALVGKVCMDQNCPADLKEETEQSIQNTEVFINTLLNNGDALVRPIITPRFALTSSEELMSRLGQLANRFDLHIQTHLSENADEVKEVKKKFPNAKNYADVYERAKLLTRKTIVAHCVHLEDSEIELLREKRCSVAHCPDSNLCLRSGLCDVRRLLNVGVNVSLGTDVAGGSSHSMLDTMRSCINTSIALSFIYPDYTPLSYHEAFYLATMGGAKALDMEDKLGNFEVGKWFDAMVVDTRNYPMTLNPQLSISELFEKFIYMGDDRNIHRTYVNGKNVQVHF
ncbi:guanine deaminase [Macrosteles quadrilineatus]|uniref:guanine deaminase n=1 Tax=Macrosteles quadrilineatus TaxID=74068 RepID=UPI0023E16374|nr:guanine deaminase [Macrosteles quadrilineatus]